MLLAFLINLAALLFLMIPLCRSYRRHRTAYPSSISRTTSSAG
jgi:hypothetical protein